MERTVSLHNPCVQQFPLLWYTGIQTPANVNIHCAFTSQVLKIIWVPSNCGHPKLALQISTYKIEVGLYLKFILLNNVQVYFPSSMYVIINIHVRTLFYYFLVGTTVIRFKSAFLYYHTFGVTFFIAKMLWISRVGFSFIQHSLLLH